MGPGALALGPLETEPVMGMLSGAPRHQLLTRGWPLRARGLMSLVKCWALGMDQEQQGLCPPAADQFTEGGRGVLSLGRWSQGLRQALEMVQEALEGLVQEALEGLVQGLRLVIGAI